jgi:hypothetical protein
MSVYNHRQLVPGAGGSNRANELLDALKQEFDNLQQEAAMYKMQRDDLEHKGEFKCSIRRYINIIFL